MYILEYVPETPAIVFIKIYCALMSKLSDIFLSYPKPYIKPVPLIFDEVETVEVEAVTEPDVVDAKLCIPNLKK